MGAAWPWALALLVAMPARYRIEIIPRSVAVIGVLVAAELVPTTKGILLVKQIPNLACVVVLIAQASCSSRDVTE